MKLITSIFSLSFLMLIGCSNKEAEPSNNEIALADSMKAAVKGWIDAVNSSKYDEMKKYVANDVIEHQSLTDRKGTLHKNAVEGFKEFAATWGAKYHGYKIEIEDMITDGNIIAIRTYETGNKERDSAGVKILTPVQKSGTIWLRWENSKFVEMWDHKESKHFPLF